MSSKAIGIDLGTTNSCVAIFEYGCVEIIADDKGNRTTPSYVAFTNDGLFTGQKAKNWETTDPSKVISSTKRLIGRKFDDDAVQENINQFPFMIIQDNSKLKIEVEYGDMTVNFLPEQISAMILSELKDITEKYLGTKVTDAVITVPAYFNNAQREATCDAAKIAGLNVLRLINEPTAAAIAYGFEKREEMNVLVFDLGSGTFDVSVLSTDNGVFEVKSTGGNTNLGGNDFDIRLVQHCIDEFERKHSKNITSDKNAYRKLQISCELAKCQLSFNSDTLIDIENLYDGIDFHVKISRSKFEDLCEDLFYLTIKSVEKAITDSYLEKNEIDKVILVGGSSRIPFIQRLIREFFDGKELCDSINPDQAVAYGAAVQAAILSGIEPEIMQDLLLIDVTPISLGLEEFGGLMAVLVKANTPIPINITEVFTTTTDNQNRLRFKVYEGENKMARSNHLLGEFVLENIRPASRGVPQIDVTFGLDENGILNVTAVDRETGNTNHITISNDSGRLTKDEICQMRQQAEIMHEADSKEYSRISARTMLDNYIYQIQSMLQTSNFECDSKITSNVGQIKEWLQENKSANESEFNEKLNELRRFIN